ncbi:MAG: FadR/GntR family transcriptional regulator [Leucobacter sp.]
MTRSIGRKGRVLTPDGKRLARNRAKQIERHEHFERALDLRSVDELLDYLRARRSLEGEAAYLAALRLDDEALARLDQCTEKQEASIRGGTLLEDGAGVDVHREMVAALDSPVFKAIIESLLSSLPNIERAMEMIMINRGAADAALQEHRAVVDAIRRREPELARTLMHRHFERLESDVRIYCNEQVITNLSRIEAESF